jgi:hypothetical protein
MGMFNTKSLTKLVVIVILFSVGSKLYRSAGNSVVAIAAHNQEVIALSE